jgi:hypothetical protein
MYGYNFISDSTYELIPPKRNTSILDIKIGTEDSVLYYEQLVVDTNRVKKLIKYDLKAKTKQTIFDKSFINYGLAKGDSLLVFTSALAYGTSSPVNKTPIAYGQKVYSYNFYTKEIKRLSDRLNYEHLVNFYVYSDLNLLFMSNYNDKHISMFLDKKGYAKYDLRNDTHEYLLNIRNDKGKLVTQLYIFDGIYNGLDINELVIASNEELYQYDLSKKEGKEILNYIKQKGYKTHSPYQINNVRPLVNQNGYILSVINANTFELIYVVIDKNGKILREFLPDMTTFKEKYSPKIEIMNK